jgi:hypothetical protein
MQLETRGRGGHGLEWHLSVLSCLSSATELVCSRFAHRYGLVIIREGSCILSRYPITVKQYTCATRTTS